MGKSVMKSRMIKSRGFSLLEIIIALTIIGIVLVSLATYARKVIDEHLRQVDAEAVAQEIYGVLQFVNADTIEIFGSTNPGDTTERVTKKVTNPLYQLPGMSVYPDAKADSPDANLAKLKGMKSNPIWLIHPHHDDASLIAAAGGASPYIGRSVSKNITSPISNILNIQDGNEQRYSYSLKWSQSLWKNNSVRSYFTDSGCPGSTGNNNVYFKQQFLSCNENPTLRNSEIAVSRIDLVNDKGTFNRTDGSNDIPAPVNRVDVYVSFTPVDGKPARLEQFITPLITAFRIKKIVPNTNNAYLVMSVGSDKNNSWTLLNKTNGVSAGNNTQVDDLAMLTDLPNMIGLLQKGRTYAIRFTFDGSGDYLRTDGLNAATKLCWNISAGAAGPCLTSPSDELLVLKSRKSPTELANLQVGSVISTISHDVKDDKGNTIRTDIKERYTAPRIQYKTFSNKGDVISPVYETYEMKGNKREIKYCLVGGSCDRAVVEATVNGRTISHPDNGAIKVDLQTCPVADGFTRDPDEPDDPDNHRLYPRLSAAVSSVVSGITKNGQGEINKTMHSDILSHQDRNINNLHMNGFSVNRIGGVVLQIRNEGNAWLISGVVPSEDIDPSPGQERTLIYFNPSWLSVMITTWCSDKKQP